MSKYDREEKELDRLEKQVRELKKENKSLHKRLKQLSRGYRKFLAAETEEEDKEALSAAKKEAEKICYDCQKGILEVKVVLNRRWRECTICPKRTRTKLIN
jgi:dsDNA-specific endonuclease/ATPase MutS2